MKPLASSLGKCWLGWFGSSDGGMYRAANSRRSVSVKRRPMWCIWRGCCVLANNIVACLKAACNPRTIIEVINIASKSSIRVNARRGFII